MDVGNDADAHDSLLLHYIINDVQAKAQGDLAEFWRIAVSIGICPAVADIGFIGIEHHHAAVVVEHCECLRRLVVVFVNLG